MPDRPRPHAAHQFGAEDRHSLRVECRGIGRHQRESERAACLVGAPSAHCEAQGIAPACDGVAPCGPVGDGGGFVGGDGALEECGRALHVAVDAVDEVLGRPAEEGTEDRDGGRELRDVNGYLYFVRG